MGTNVVSVLMSEEFFNSLLVKEEGPLYMRTSPDGTLYFRTKESIKEKFGKVYVLKERIDISYELLSSTIIGVYSSLEMANKMKDKYQKIYEDSDSQEDASYYVHEFVIDEEAIGPLDDNATDRY